MVNVKRVYFALWTIFALSNVWTITSSDEVLVKSTSNEKVVFPDEVARYARQSADGCDIEVSEEEGWLFSPNYPSNYDNLRDCTFTIRKWRKNVCQLQITIQDFDLDDSGNCRGDYLDIREGVPQSGLLCGSLASGTKKTLTFPRSRPSMNLHFHSDGQQTRKGFMIKVVQLANSCNRNDGYDPPGPGPRPLPPSPPPRNCDQYIQGVRQVVTSPGYPRRYPPNSRCRYVLQRADRTVCKVEFIPRNFDLEQSQGCRKDYLELPGGARVCGRHTTPAVMEFTSDSDNLQISFFSDDYSEGGGFDFEVRQLRNSCGRDKPQPIPVYVPVQAHQHGVLAPNPYVRAYSDAWNNLNRLSLQLYYRLVGAGRLQYPVTPQHPQRPYRRVPFCDHVIDSLDGRISSPGYPAQYGPNQKCIYTIRRASPLVCVVSAEFYFFEVDAASNNCDRDYLEMPDGKKLCGSASGEKLYTFSALSDTLQIIFYADNFGSGRGFDIKITQRSHTCGGNAPLSVCDQKIIDESDVIRSPNYPSEYPSFSQCDYDIQRFASDICQVKLEFLDFDLGDAPCSADYLEIDGAGQRLCGRGLIKDKVMTFPPGTDRLLLVFRSGTNQLKRGFEIKVTQLRNTCYQPYDDSSQQRTCASDREASTVIQTDGYPSNYLPDTDCLYKFTKSSSDVCQLQLNFERFDVGTEAAYCYDDYLEITGTRYCGIRDRQSVVVDFPSSQSELRFLFRSDGRNQRSGFRIQVRQITQGCSNDRQPTPNRNCGDTFRDVSFDLISPGFQNGSYPPNEDCRYVIRKSSYDVCALEVKYNVFDIEESDDCTKDFLEIRDQKICGRLPFDSTRTYEFPEDTLTIRFRSDNFARNAGFFMTVKQTKC